MCPLTYNILMPSKEENFKQSVKDWLKNRKRDRDWLAEQCGVKKTAVDEWFKKRRDIPTSYAIIIKNLMDGPVIDDFGSPPGLPDTEQKNKLFVSLDPETQTLLETQAHLDGMDLTAYCSLILEWAIHNEGAYLRDILAMFEKKWQDSNKTNN